MSPGSELILLIRSMKTYKQLCGVNAQALKAQLSVITVEIRSSIILLDLNKQIQIECILRHLCLFSS